MTKSLLLKIGIFNHITVICILPLQLKAWKLMVDGYLVPHTRLSSAYAKVKIVGVLKYHCRVFTWKIWQSVSTAKISITDAWRWLEHDSRLRNGFYLFHKTSLFLLCIQNEFPQKNYVISKEQGCSIKRIRQSWLIHVGV